MHIRCSPIYWLGWDGMDRVFRAYASSMGFVTFTMGGFLYTISVFISFSARLLEIFDPTSLESDTMGTIPGESTLRRLTLTDRYS